MSKQMQGLVLRSVLGTGGGAEKIILRTAALLKSSPCELTICGIRRGDDTNYDFDEQCRKLGLNYFEVTQNSLYDPNLWRQLREFVAKKNYDFVHTHDYKAAYLGRKLAKQFGIRTIATLHGWDGNTWREKLLYYPAERRILRSFDRVLAVSTLLKQTYVQSGGDSAHTHVILNGIDADNLRRSPQSRSETRKKFDVADDDHLLLGLGRLEQPKRFDVLMQALRILRDQGQPCKCIIAGDGSLRDFLSSCLDKLCLNNCCKLIGHCNDVLSLYNAADLMVQSSDSEGTPTVVVEAMAMELPIVATDAGGTSELMQDKKHGRIIPCQNPQKLADAIIDTLKNKGETAAYVQAARVRAENELSFRNRTNQLVAHYRALAN